MSMSTLKCEKKNRIGKSQAPRAEGGNKLGNISALARRSPFFLFPLVCFLVVFFLRRSAPSLHSTHTLYVSLEHPSGYFFSSAPPVLKCLCIYFLNEFFSANLLFCVSAKQIFYRRYGAEEWRLKRFVLSLFSVWSFTLCQTHADQSKSTIQLAPAPPEALFPFPPSPLPACVMMLALKENIKSASKKLILWRKVMEVHRLQMVYSVRCKG